MAKMVQIKLLTGTDSHVELLDFSFSIESISPTEIVFQMEYADPLEVSQWEEPEVLEIVINMEKYTDPDGLSLARNLTLHTFNPRQIPNPDAASSIASYGSFLAVILILLIVSNGFITLVLSLSFEHLWSLFNALQLISHMPFYQTPMPANANYFCTYLLPISVFDFVPSYYKMFFDLPAKNSYNLSF